MSNDFSSKEPNLYEIKRQDIIETSVECQSTEPFDCRCQSKPNQPNNERFAKKVKGEKVE